MLEALCHDAVCLVLLFLDLNAGSMRAALSPVSRGLAAALGADDVGRSLCVGAWRVGAGGQSSMPHWPSHLGSWWHLYRVLQRYAPLEGFYSCPSAWPWGLLFLLRFYRGEFIGEVLKGEDGMGRTEILRVTFAAGATGAVATVCVCGGAGSVEEAAVAGNLAPTNLPLEWPSLDPSPHALARAQFESPGGLILRRDLRPPRASPTQGLGARVMRRVFWTPPDVRAPDASSGNGEALEDTGAVAANDDDDDNDDDGGEAVGGGRAEEDSESGEPASASQAAELIRATWAPGVRAPDARAMVRALLAYFRVTGGAGGASSGLHLGPLKRRTARDPGLRLRPVEGPCAAARAAAREVAFAAAQAGERAGGSDNGGDCGGGGTGGGGGGAVVPFIHPGLYVGAYGDNYGQHKYEVLQIEYRRFLVGPSDFDAWPEGSVWAAMHQEVFDGRHDPAGVGGEAGGSFLAHPTCAVLGQVHAALVAAAAHGASNGGGGGEGGESGGGGVEAVFCVGKKVTGDVHVPAGAATWAALVSPPPFARHAPGHAPGHAAADPAASVDAAGRLASFVAATTVRERHVGAREPVVRGWPGWGTLAFPGFRQPSWSSGQLCQLASAPCGGQVVAGNHGRGGGGGGGASSDRSRGRSASDRSHSEPPRTFVDEEDDDAGAGGSLPKEPAVGSSRFAFMWEREDQPATVLRWLSAQSEHPFLRY